MSSAANKQVIAAFFCGLDGRRYDARKRQHLAVVWIIIGDTPLSKTLCGIDDNDVS